MTAVAFAEAMDVNYTTVMRWLRNNLVPEAEQIEPIPGMTIWQIPESALQMPRPKSGPKRGTKRTGVRKDAEASANGLPFEPPATSAKPKARAKKAARKTSKKAGGK